MARDFASDPTWTERYNLGKMLNQHLDAQCTLQDLGDELGVSKQNAYTESVLALGSLGWALCKRLGLSPSDAMRMLRGQ
jgi:hypothetical protein